MSVTLQTALGELNVEGRLSASTTVNFDSSMTYSQMQALIDAQPKDLGGYTLTFQFADGTYNLGSNTLSFSRFSFGLLYIFGNTSTDLSAASTKSVMINTDNSSAISISNCDDVVVASLSAVSTDDTWNVGAISLNTTRKFIVQYCSASKGGTTAGFAISVYYSMGIVQYTYVSKGYYGLYARNALVEAGYNYAFGTYPLYGCSSDRGAFIALNYNVISGSNASTLETNGGLIRS